MRRIVGLILVIALTIFATLAETFRNNLWISYRDYTSPYLADLPAGAARASPSPRVVLVLVRGLRLDSSRQMATLNELRKRGADLVVQYEPPTYRLPVWSTLMSGATAETHGITTNYAPRTDSSSSIFHEMQLAGEPAAIVGSQALGDAFGAEVQRFEPVDNPDLERHDDDAIRITFDVLRDASTPARLVCVELSAIEDTLRNDPASYGTALSVTDTRIKTLLDGLDLGANTVIILSDHGLTQDAKDGGAEPEIALAPMIMAGVGVAPGVQSMIQATDIAPTLAALLGSPLPVHAQGQPALSALSLPADAAPGLVITQTGTVSETVVTTATLAPLAPLPDLLWASAIQLTTFYESWSEAIKQPRFAAELLRASQDAIRSGDTNAYNAFFIDLNTRANAARVARLDTERAQRLPLAIGAALFLIALIGISLTSRRWQPVLGAILYIAAWYVLFTLIRGHRFSLSMFDNGDPSAFLSAIARDSAILFTGVSILVAVLTGRHEDGLDSIATVLMTLLLIVGVQVAQAVWFYFQWGNTFTWNLPDTAALVTVLVALTQASALSLRIVPELPNLPIPLAIAFLTLAIYSLVRSAQRERPGRYGRLR